MKLLVNAWSLCAAPQSPLSYHLQEILAELRAVEPELQLVLACPAQPTPELVEGAAIDVVETGMSGWGRLWFEQRELPRIAGDHNADLILNPHASAPLRSPAPIAALAAGTAEEAADGFLLRLRRAVGAAGLTGAARLRWSDGPAPARGDEISLRPSVSPAFRATDPGDDRETWAHFDLPRGFVMCLGADQVDLPLLLAAWTWVDASVGDTYPLVFVGLGPGGRDYVQERSEELDVSDSVQSLEQVELSQLPALYRGAEVLLHPGRSVTGQELRWALATGTPIASRETPLAASIAGGAAYLAAKDNTRSLGASCLTLLVERREMAQPLREKGLLVAGKYHDAEARRSLAAALRHVSDQAAREES